MKIVRYIILIWLLICSPLIVICQYSGIAHYTVKDGLPSSTNYSVIQDNRGFIWVGTEAGLVRYDGTNFKVFNTLNGLPDNEVLGILPDGKTDKIWIITYCKSACYYKDGKIYTAQNDSSLSTITCDYGEFIKGNNQEGGGVFLYNGRTIFKCADNSITKIQTQKDGIAQVRQCGSGVDIIYGSGLAEINSGVEKKYHGSYIDSVCQNGKWIGNKLFVFRNGRIDVYSKMNNEKYQLNGNIRIDVKRIFTNLIQLGSKYYISVEGIGVFVTDTSLNGSIKKIWSGRVNDMSKDNDGNIWVSTNGDGLFVIKNQPVINCSSENGLLHDNITAISGGAGGNIFLGNSYGEIFTLKDNAVHPIPLKQNTITEMIRGMVQYDSSVFLLINNMIGHFDLRDQKFREIPHKFGGPKSILKLRNNQTIIVGFSSGISEFDARIESMREIRVNKRILALAQHPDGRVYCGSLDGLYEYRADTLERIRGDRRLQNRITSLCFGPDSILWIGTPSNGVIAFDGKRVIGDINTSKYVSYNGALCRKVVSSGKSNEIWVATNSGIDRISYHYRDSLIIDNITPLNTSDGLLSDDVNDLLVQDGMIYAATSHGITILNEWELSKPRPVPIYLASVKINDSDSLIHQSVYELTYHQNNIQIEYIGISLQSAGYLRYQYRLLGSSSDQWQTTDRTSIDLRSISPGIYTFEVAVLDKFGNRSLKTAKVQFHIARPFYQTIWFISLLLIVIISAGFLVIKAIFDRRKRQYEKEQSYNNKIIDLEQQALKAQMNPHFIFNCLTAIQHFVNKEDVYSANMYLSSFAKLIRKTLDLSGEQYITLDREAAYLENYIQLEKMRFQEQFNYVIHVDRDLDPFNTLIPPMLLQPIIENAIRHGLRYKDNNEGMLKVNFSREGDSLICQIDDNGIGIKKSRELKSTSHVEYQSKGMKLTESRIAAINMISDKKISMEVTDKYNAEGNAIGTLVIIKFEQ